MNCYGTGLVRECFTTPPSATHTLDASINTDTSTLCDPDISAWCVIAGASITVQNTVSATGSRPLVLIATGTITVSGTLDVASYRVAGTIGAGANPAACDAGTAPGTAGGGAGGS